MGLVISKRRIRYWLDCATCWWAGHAWQRRVQFDGHGGVWQGANCARCGRWAK